MNHPDDDLDPALQALYRKLPHHTPGADMDRRILSAASGRKWPAGVVPISAAASLLLASTLVLYWGTRDPGGLERAVAVAPARPVVLNDQMAPAAAPALAAPAEVAAEPESAPAKAKQEQRARIIEQEERSSGFGAARKAQSDELKAADRQSLASAAMAAARAPAGVAAAAKPDTASGGTANDGRAASPAAPAVASANPAGANAADAIASAAPVANGAGQAVSPQATPQANTAEPAAVAVVGEVAADDNESATTAGSSAARTQATGTTGTTVRARTSTAARATNTTATENDEETGTIYIPGQSAGSQPVNVVMEGIALGMTRQQLLSQGYQCTDAACTLTLTQPKQASYWNIATTNAVFRAVLSNNTVTRLVLQQQGVTVDAVKGQLALVGVEGKQTCGDEGGSLLMRRQLGLEVLSLWQQGSLVSLSVCHL